MAKGLLIAGAVVMPLSRDANGLADVDGGKVFVSVDPKAPKECCCC